MSVGSEAEAALQENAAKPKKKRKLPEVILRQVLGYDPGSGPEYGSLSDRPDIKSASRKKGETDFEALLRLEREAKERG